MSVPSFADELTSSENARRACGVIFSFIETTVPRASTLPFAGHSVLSARGKLLFAEVFTEMFTEEDGLVVGDDLLTGLHNAAKGGSTQKPLFHEVQQVR